MNTTPQHKLKTSVNTLSQIEDSPLEIADIDDLLHVTSDDHEEQGQSEDILSDVNDFLVEEMKCGDEVYDRVAMTVNRSL